MARLKIFALLFILVLGASCSNKPEYKSQKLPNVVLIYADDLGWADPGYNGNTFYETPNIDRLAREGLIANRFYPAAPLCAPSRASLLSGSFSPRHKIYIPNGVSLFADSSQMRFKVPTAGMDSTFDSFEVVRKNELDTGFRSMAELFASAGYKTARFGKWHLGSSNHGFEIASPNGQTHKAEVSKKEALAYYSDTSIAERLSQASIHFIKENSNNPFFLYLSHWEVHLPMFSKKARIKYYQEKKKNKPEYAAFSPVYAAELEELDRSTLMIYKTLEDLGLLENTLIIFASDNGGVSQVTSNYPLKGGKGTFFEGGLRSPCFFYWKGVTESGQTNEPINGVDFMPTLVELTQQKMPNTQIWDGESLLDLIKGEKYNRKKPMFFHFPLYLGGNPNDLILPSFSGKKNFWRAVPLTVMIKDEWKLIKYYEYDKVELYNLNVDLSETQDLSEIEHEKLRELENELDNWVKETKAPVPTVLNIFTSNN